MTFGKEADEPTSRELVDRFLGDGGNFVDTADVYNQARRRRSSAAPWATGATT
jgi:aryl-alcohol dehydrogenase-like predicted oxidoreductase